MSAPDGRLKLSPCTYGRLGGCLRQRVLQLLSHTSQIQVFTFYFFGKGIGGRTVHVAEEKRRILVGDCNSDCIPNGLVEEEQAILKALEVKGRNLCKLAVRDGAILAGIRIAPQAALAKSYIAKWPRSHLVYRAQRG